LPGEIYALICAFLWAFSSTLAKSQTHKVHIVLLGAIRTAPAMLLYWGLLLFSGKTADLAALPLRGWALLGGSTLLGLVAGDLLYLRSMKLLGLSRAMPLSTTHPLFTVLLALVFLHEDVSWFTAAGAILIIGGAYLLAFPRRRALYEGNPHEARLDVPGVAMALGAAICWASSTVLLRMGLTGVDVTVANAIRLSVLMTVLAVMSIATKRVDQIRTYSLSTLGVLFAAGIIGTGLGTFVFLMAVQRAGAARTSILTATTPLFGVPMALILRERPSLRTLAGTVLAVAGVWLTVY
jgi:DME family drug/metabolite transporter